MDVRLAKYSLEALLLQFQVEAISSPHLAHQILWHRFVNIRGGLGNIIQCDLYNEHMNRLIKEIISAMGPNLTESALQRAARSVSTVHAVCKQFDKVSGVPVTTSAHSTKDDTSDVGKVVCAVLSNKLLEVIPDRCHTAYKDIKLNPLWKWNKEKAINWITKKQKEYVKAKAMMDGEAMNSMINF